MNATHPASPARSNAQYNAELRKPAQAPGQGRKIEDKFAALWQTPAPAPSPTLAVASALEDPLTSARTFKLANLSRKQREVLLRALRSANLSELNKLALQIETNSLPASRKLPKLIKAVGDDGAPVEVVLHPTGAQGSFGKVQRGRLVDTTAGQVHGRVAAKVFRGEERFKQDMAKLDARLERAAKPILRGKLGLDHDLLTTLESTKVIASGDAQRVRALGGRTYVLALVAGGVIDAQQGYALMVNRAQFHRLTPKVQESLTLTPFVTVESVENETSMAAEAESPLAEQARISAKGRIYSLMRLMDGETFDVIARSGNMRPAKRHLLAEYIALEVSSELAPYTHMVHGDLKLENIWHDRDGVVLPGDWGFAQKVDTQGKAHGVNGTPGFAAPEVIAGLPYTPAADVYSLGMTIAVAATCDMPFVDTGATGQLRTTQDLEKLRASLPEDAEGMVTLSDLSAQARRAQGSARHKKSAQFIGDFFRDWGTTHASVATFVLSKMLCNPKKRASMAEVHTFFAQRKVENRVGFEQAKQCIASAYGDPSNQNNRVADALVDAFAAAYTSPVA